MSEGKEKYGLERAPDRSCKGGHHLVSRKVWEEVMKHDYREGREAVAAFERLARLETDLIHWFVL